MVAVEAKLNSRCLCSLEGLLPGKVPVASVAAAVHDLHAVISRLGRCWGRVCATVAGSVGHGRCMR